MLWGKTPRQFSITQPMIDPQDSRTLVALPATSCHILYTTANWHATSQTAIAPEYQPAKTSSHFKAITSNIMLPVSRVLGMKIVAMLRVPPTPVFVDQTQLLSN